MAGMMDELNERTEKIVKALSVAVESDYKKLHPEGPPLTILATLSKEIMKNRMALGVPPEAEMGIEFPNDAEADAFMFFEDTVTRCTTVFTGMIPCFRKVGKIVFTKYERPIKFVVEVVSDIITALQNPIGQIVRWSEDTVPACVDLDYRLETIEACLIASFEAGGRLKYAKVGKTVNLLTARTSTELSAQLLEETK